MKFSVLKKGWSLLSRPEKHRAILVLGVVVLSALTSALMVGSIMPFLAALADSERIRNIEAFAWAYEFGGFDSDYGFLVALGVASLSAIVLANGLQILRVYLVNRFATMRMHSLSLRLLRTYLRQPYEYFLDKNGGELGTQILAETQQVVHLFYRPAAEALAGALTSASIVTLLVWLNPVVATVALVIAGGLYFVSYYFSRKAVSRFGKIRAKANADRFRVATEALAGVKDIKLLGRESNYADTYATPSFDMARAEATAIFIGTLPQYIMQIVAFGGMIVLILLLLDPAALSKSETMADLLPLLGVFAFGGQKLIPELAKIYSGITQLAYGAPVVEALHRDLSAEDTLPPLLTHDVRPLGLHRELELRNVRFAYPNFDGAGLAGVSVSIRAGERVGVVGGSGAGKTTLADVIMGLLKISSGEIVVDGTVLTDDNARAWQRSVGYVQQGIFLSDGSIAENIALGIQGRKIDHSREAELLGEVANPHLFMERGLRRALLQTRDLLLGLAGGSAKLGARRDAGAARQLIHEMLQAVPASCGIGFRFSVVHVQISFAQGAPRAHLRSGNAESWQVTGGQNTLNLQLIQ